MAPPYLFFFPKSLIKFKIVPETKTLESFDDNILSGPFRSRYQIIFMAEGFKGGGESNGCNFVQGNILEKQHETNNFPLRSCSD